MLTNKTLNSLKGEVEKLEGRLATFEHRKTGEHERLQESYLSLAKELSELKGGIAHVNTAFTAMGVAITAIGIVFAVLIGLSVVNLIRYRNFETVRGDAYDILGDVFQSELASAIDQLTLVTPPTEQERLANNINRTQKHLINLGVDSEEFKRQSELANALDLVLRDKKVEALEKLDEVIRYSTDDSFVNSRAKALKAYTIISKNGRTCGDVEVPKLLNEALEKDSQIAIVYNAMGLCNQEVAARLREQAKTDSLLWDRYGDKMQMAVAYYRIASEIKPTVQSKYRAINNHVWANCAMFEATLHEGFPMEKFSKVTGYETNQEFFNDSLNQLNLAHTLSPSNSLVEETKSELSCLQAASEKESQKAARYWKEAKELYLGAISHGLFDKFSSCNEALNYFTRDALLGDLRVDQEVLSAIKSKYPPGACH